MQSDTERHVDNIYCNQQPWGAPGRTFEYSLLDTLQRTVLFCPVVLANQINPRNTNSPARLVCSDRRNQNGIFKSFRTVRKFLPLIIQRKLSRQAARSFPYWIPKRVRSNKTALEYSPNLSLFLFFVSSRLCVRLVSRNGQSLQAERRQPSGSRKEWAGTADCSFCFSQSSRCRHSHTRVPIASHRSRRK